MANHNNVTGPNVHTPYRQVFADAAARAADATDYIAADVNKKALQLDTNVEYRLSSIGPTTWTKVGDGASGATMQGAYTGGGAIALDVDGGNDLAWDSAVADSGGLGLFGIRRNIGGGEISVLKAPNQPDDSANSGTTMGVLAGKGSDQTAVGVAGTTGGDTLLGGIVAPGGNGGPASGAGANGGAGGNGGQFSGLASAGGGGGVGVAADDGGGGGGGGAQVEGPGAGGTGGASAGAGAGGNGGAAGFGTYGEAAGGIGGDGSATGFAGAGGIGSTGQFRGGAGGDAGADNGGGGAVGGAGGASLGDAGAGGVGTGVFNGGRGGDSRNEGGDGGAAAGSGDQGDGGDARLDGGAGDTPGVTRIATDNSEVVESGTGTTQWDHNGRRVIGLGIIGSVQTVADVETTVGSFPTTTNDRAFVIDGTVVARRADGERKAWVFSALAHRGASAASTTVDSLAILNGPQESIALPWVIVADDDGAGVIRIRVDANEATTIDWSVQARVQEI